MPTQHGRARNISSQANRPAYWGCPGIPPTVGLNASIGNVYRKRLACGCACTVKPASFAYGCSVGCVNRPGVFRW